MDLNKVMLIGNVTRDPEVRTTPSGQTVATFGLATNRVWTDASGVKQEKAEFHNIVAWGKLAEICGQYLHKGRKTYIEGRLQTHDWTGDDGVRRFKTETIAENMILLDRAPAASGAAPSPLSSAQAPQEPEPASPPATNEEKEIKVEQIPF
jgi:single-strand DNA-binding protein